jgi:Flp pilus assembly protein TadG
MTVESSEAGTVTTEMAVITSFFLAGFLMFVVFAGRLAQAENEVRSAAHEAARAATLTGDPGTAVAEARAVAAANLEAAGLTCARGMQVAVDASGLQPGSYVSVTVTCTADFGDVTSLGVPGARTFAATATEIVDVHRSGVP